MAKSAHLLLALTALSGCSYLAAEDEGAVKAEARKVWTQCLFELDKVEAIRGRNLDDLNRGGAVARNQFLMDCLATRDVLSLEIVQEMSRYKANEGRTPSEMNLYQQAYELTHWNHSRLAMDLMVSGSSMRSFHALQQAVTMVS